MEQLAIYLWSISDNIKYLLVIYGGAAIVVGSFAIIATEDFTRLFPKVIITMGLLSFVFAAFIPSKQDLAVILLYPAAKEGVSKIVQSETAQQLHEVGKLYLQKKIKELKTND